MRTGFGTKLAKRGYVSWVGNTPIILYIYVTPEIMNHIAETEISKISYYSWKEINSMIEFYFEALPILDKFVWQGSRRIIGA